MERPVNPIFDNIHRKLMTNLECLISQEKDTNNLIKLNEILTLIKILYNKN